MLICTWLVSCRNDGTDYRCPETPILMCFSNRLKVIPIRAVAVCAYGHANTTGGINAQWRVDVERHVQL